MPGGGRGSTAAALSAQGPRGRARSSRAFARTRSRPTGRSCSTQAGGGADARWGIVATDRPAQGRRRRRSTSRSSRRWVDPRAEWAQIFQRDVAHPARLLLRREDARRRLAGGARRSTAPLAAVREPSRRSRLSHRADGRRAHGRPLVSHRRGRRARRSRRCRSACSAPTSRSRTGAIASRASTRARTGIPICARRSARPASRSPTATISSRSTAGRSTPPANIYSVVRGHGGPADGAFASNSDAVDAKARGS